MSVSFVPVQAGLRLAFAPPPSLARVVRHLHVEVASSGVVTVPATPAATLTFFVRGGTLGMPLGAAFLCGPLSAPAQACWAPDTAFVSALIAAPYLPLLFGVQAGELADRAVPLADLSPRPDTGALEEALRALGDPARWAELTFAWLARLRREGRDAPFLLPPALLDSPTAEIAAHCGLSVRQLERRHLAAYGLPVRDSRRMARYVRALGALMSAPVRRGALTAIAMDAGYHDQAHMIRDFAHYTGRAPGALAAGIAARDDTLRLFRYEPADRAVVLR